MKIAFTSITRAEKCAAGQSIVFIVLMCIKIMDSMP